MKPSPQPTILLVYPGQHHYMDEALRGVRQYEHEHTRWNLVLLRRGTGVYSRAVRPAEVRGVIGMLGPREADLLKPYRAAIVNLSARFADPGYPSVVPDNVAVGCMAARHLLSKGLRRFGCVTETDLHYAVLRRDGFVARLAEDGLTVDRLDHAFDRNQPDVGRDIRRWIRHLQPPIGIVASHDKLAAMVIDAALRRGLRVPQDMAVVGVDNNPLTCDLAPVPLSSVDTDGRRVGYQAAELLDRLMRGDPAPGGPILIPPLRVEERDSTRVIVAGHPAVQAAITAMQDRIADIQVSDLVEASGVSRRHLEQLFRLHMGESPYNFLLNLKFERARSLLVTTDLPMAEVGRRAGFPDPKNFARQFRLRFGVAPSVYRERRGRLLG